MQLLSTIMPAIALMSDAASSAPALPTVPEPFRGEWNRNVADCGTDNNNSLLEISAGEIIFFESAGLVRGTFLNGPHEVLSVANMSGQNEPLMTAYKFTVAADGSSLMNGDEKAGALIRYRCPPSTGD